MKQRRYSQLQQIGVVIAFFLFIFLCIKTYRYGQYVFAQTGISPTVALQLLFGKGVTLKSTDDRTNILLLGIGGGAHDGADLTDTIMIASISHKTPSVSLISIPRDIWSETLKDRINSAYHYGEEKKKGGGRTLARAIMEDVIGLPIHYVVVIDFSQFEKLIDQVGGVTVTIPKTFTDSEYPIAGKENDLCDGDPLYKCRYETITFTAGNQHMDGATALKYVRSRHAEGDEGTDFARGKRQQDVIIALKDQILSMQPWFHPDIALKLLTFTDQATDTDMTIGEQLTIGKYLAFAKSLNISKIAIDTLLINPPSWMYGRYVLIPEKDFDTIHTYIQHELIKN